MKSSKFAANQFQTSLVVSAHKKFINDNETGKENNVLPKDVTLEKDQIPSRFLKSSSIKELDSAVTRKICTSQVVISLAGACRELIDNSLDADATNIEIRVKESGVDQIEVIDNGHGIEKSNFELLCKAHSTSKLSAISDFNSLSTFGFRGEALNALAALSELTITTRDLSSKVGTRISFDKDGKILKQENCPRKVGTSVIIAKLFYSLPVRRQEFQRNSRREFMKMISCVQSFALSCKCRFTLLNYANGKLNHVLASPGSSALKETISCLFGSKVEKGDILEIKEVFPSEEICSQYGVSNVKEGVFHQIGISGFVSSSSFGHGRSASDRQFIYVNRRSVDVPKLNRIINEVYSSFNRGRYSMLVLFITVDPKYIDVNVSPDKRTVFFQCEKELFAKFRASLLATFSNNSGNCPKSNATSIIDVVHTTKILPQTQMSDEDIVETDNVSHVSSPLTPSPGKLDSPTTSFKFDTHSFRSTSSIVQTSRKRQIETSGDLDNCISVRIAGEKIPKRRDWAIEDISSHKSNAEDERIPLIIKDRPLKTLDDFSFYSIQAKKSCISPDPSLTKNQMNVINVGNQPINDNQKEMFLSKNEGSAHFSTSLGLSKNLVLRPQQKLTVDLDAIRSLLKKKRVATLSIEEMSPSLNVQKSSDMIDENQSEEKSEEHLSVMLDKYAFLRMEVVGQFNNSFIITRLENQMFIIDQHASDEKYNFEKLQRSSQVTTQKLIIPQKLSLGAVQENVLYDNLDVLRGNGFNFIFDDQEPIGNKVCLASVPNIQGCDFNSDDVEEIIAFLMEFPGCFYRPAKIRRIFASKACRRSVMFGKALTAQKMDAIVKAMGTMDSPWNCPHGRPTIRHLCSMNYQENVH